MFLLPFIFWEVVGSYLFGSLCAMYLTDFMLKGLEDGVPIMAVVFSSLAGGVAGAYLMKFLPELRWLVSVLLAEAWIIATVYINGRPASWEIQDAVKDTAKYGFSMNRWSDIFTDLAGWNAFFLLGAAIIIRLGFMWCREPCSLFYPLTPNFEHKNSLILKIRSAKIGRISQDKEIR